MSDHDHDNCWDDDCEECWEEGYDEGWNEGRKSAKRSGSRSRPTSNTEGCYVATAVYGSYDCPEVWVLRRFRDFSLSKKCLGRAFIRCYYAISPAVVRAFGNNKYFKAIIKWPLDMMVLWLHNRGVENTPYNDKNWM